MRHRRGEASRAGMTIVLRSLPAAALLVSETPICGANPVVHASWTSMPGPPMTANDSHWPMTMRTPKSDVTAARPLACASGWCAGGAKKRRRPAVAIQNSRVTAGRTLGGNFVGFLPSRPSKETRWATRYGTGGPLQGSARGNNFSCWASTEACFLQQVLAGTGLTDFSK